MAKHQQFSGKRNCFFFFWPLLTASQDHGLGERSLRGTEEKFFCPAIPKHWGWIPAALLGSVPSSREPQWLGGEGMRVPNNDALATSVPENRRKSKCSSQPGCVFYVHFPLGAVLQWIWIRLKIWIYKCGIFGLAACFILNLCSLLLSLFLNFSF